MIKWFINANNFIKGPYSSEEAQQQIQQFNDQLMNTFLWSRGHSEWIRADKWSMNSTQTVSLPEVNSQAPVKKVLSTDQANIEKMRVQYDFKDQGPMTKEELIAFTAKQEDVSKIAIFDTQTRDWKDIFSMPDIVQHLGLIRREDQRVPILAQFSGVHLNTGETINARVITVSRGGIGITDNFSLKLAETIQGQLTSPHFFSPVNLTAEVTYSGLDGYVGLKFINTNNESLSLIMDYIKRFGKDGEN